MTVLTVVMAQVNTLVGDIDGNTDLIIERAKKAKQQQADVVVFPELTLCGYPPEDLLLRPSIKIRIGKALKKLAGCAGIEDLYLLVGYPLTRGEHLYNVVGVLYQGRWIAEYAKQILPNYQVFDEKRYFTAGEQCCVLDIKGLPVALTICEDIWEPGPMRQAASAGAKLMLNLNASPFHIDKQELQ